LEFYFYITFETYLPMSSVTETEPLKSRSVLKLTPTEVEAVESVSSSTIIRENNLLKVPLFEDPRRMNRRKLLSELKKRDINAHGSTAVLVARLLKSMVDEGLKQNFEADVMSDCQPEKWLLLANQAFSEACELEGDPKKRVACMESVNAWIEQEIKSGDMLRQVAVQQLVDQEKCDLFKILLRYATALMLCPDVENEAVAGAGVSSDVVRASMFMFNMMTGFGRIPDHLTEEFAAKEEQEILKNPVRLGKRKVVKVETENGDTICIMNNQRPTTYC
jgi:hypothetical protein